MNILFILAKEKDLIYNDFTFNTHIILYHKDPQVFILNL